MAISGNHVIVAARNDDTGAQDTGSVYQFDLSTGLLVRTFNNPEPAYDDYFGSSVAVSGNLILVGAWGDDTAANESGSAYLFDAVTGTLLHTLNNPTPGSYDWFGVSVAIAGNDAVIGAWYDDTGEIDTGSAYLFDATTGALRYTLNNPAPAEDDNFGNSVAVSGNNVVVGAYKDDAGGDDAGSVYLFDAATGALQRTFNNPMPTNNWFGSSVAASGSHILVNNYLFDAVTGALVQTFSIPGPGATGQFGDSEIFSDNYFILRSPFDNTGATASGSAHVFDAMTGLLLRTFTNPTPAEYDQFGHTAAISGNYVVIGALADDTGARDAGSAYLYDLSLICPTSTSVPTPAPSPTAPGASPTASPTATPCCPGDADNSGGAVNANDFLAVQAAFGMDNGTGGLGDADCSGGAVNASDFLAVQANFGASCG